MKKAFVVLLIALFCEAGNLAHAATTVVTPAPTAVAPKAPTLATCKTLYDVNEQPIGCAQAAGEVKICASDGRTCKPTLAGYCTCGGF